MSSRILIQLSSLKCFETVELYYMFTAAENKKNKVVPIIETVCQSHLATVLASAEKYIYRATDHGTLIPCSLGNLEQKINGR